MDVLVGRVLASHFGSLLPAVLASLTFRAGVEAEF